MTDQKTWWEKDIMLVNQAFLHLPAVFLQALFASVIETGGFVVKS